MSSRCILGGADFEDLTYRFSFGEPDPAGGRPCGCTR